MTRRFSRLGGKTMGAELRQEVVARQGSSVCKQKQEFDDQITMFRLEKNIYTER